MKSEDRILACAVLQEQDEGRKVAGQQPDLHQDFLRRQQMSELQLGFKLPKASISTAPFRKQAWDRNIHLLAEQQLGLFQRGVAASPQH